MRKLVAVLTVVAAAVAFAPRPAAAQEAECTDNYVKCLNDSYHLKGLLQVMADVECFADYVGCVAADIVRK